MLDEFNYMRILIKDHNDSDAENYSTIRMKKLMVGKSLKKRIQAANTILESIQHLIHNGIKQKIIFQQIKYDYQTNKVLTS